MNIGEKVKNLRNEQGMTLKQLSEETGLSTGFLSQFERGITTIAVEHLATIADLFKVKINYFFEDESVNEPIVRGYDQPVIHKLNNIIYKQLSRSPKDKMIAPKLIEIMPHENRELPTTYPHQGEEFIYILEGILTLVIEETTYQLYPGDSAHYFSTINHNWDNQTNNVVKFIVVHHPNDY
ncbi:helix-turn-helix domain-containing protein [Enterococcus dongliensis]|uniref:helix-turn-helix domain-containing protein n=1 Tax=Enterococcus dongliensis TaxID=2559925 RepID=UPI002892550C|nr:XRE family transcriptional regulator [Enterococcus dongliensis]MDT2702494.1 XRE family transcriptional regulator [Enterococcus dongliensis]